MARAMDESFDYFLRVDEDGFLCIDSLLSTLPSKPPKHFLRGRFHCDATMARMDENFMLFSRDAVQYFLSGWNDGSVPFHGETTLALNVGSQLSSLHAEHGWTFQSEPHRIRWDEPIRKTDGCSTHIWFHHLAPVAAGRCHGSHPELSEWRHDQSERIRGLVPLMRSFRFALVMENGNAKGYVSEKIANAFMASTIPIYYGTTDVFKLFNKDAFIYYDVHDPQTALDRIAYLETNRTAYAEVLAQPILADGERTLEEYFSLSDDVGGGKLKQRIRNMVLGKV